jgi:hypothetical protein
VSLRWDRRLSRRAFEILCLGFAMVSNLIVKMMNVLLTLTPIGQRDFEECFANFGLTTLWSLETRVDETVTGEQHPQTPSFKLAPQT